MAKKLLVVFFATATAILVFVLIMNNDRRAFPDLKGPEAPTSMPVTPGATSIDAYDYSGTHSMALFLRDVESSWLGLALGFKSMGQPFSITRSLDEALKHRVIMVYPSLTGANTDSVLLRRLTEHVKSGGTLIATNVVGGGMRTLFGYRNSAEHSSRQQLQIQPFGIGKNLGDGQSAFIVQLGDPQLPKSGLPGCHYTGSTQPPLALFQDGSAAITHKSFRTPRGTGHAYAIGLDIGHFIQRAFNGRFPNLSATYVNAYQPQVDNLLRLLAMIYQQGEPHAVLLSPTPHGREFTALITHDIDYTHSLENVSAYVDLAQQFDITSTFFIQTKYITDYNDAAFFDASQTNILTFLRDAGMEVASHTVSHTNELQRIPVGTGDEQYPDYRPFVQDFSTVRNATVMGELRVSKFLLESMIDTEVVSFRPGHLSLPAELPQLLEAVGYQYSSSITANEALTHLPYRLMHDRHYDTQVGVYEFPVTIEDEVGKLGDRLDQAVSLSNKIAQYHGLVTIMIHTDILSHKLEFLRQYLETFQDRAWFDTVRGFGDWWLARESIVTDVIQEAGGRYRLILEVNGSIDGLTLSIPPNWKYVSGLNGTLQEDSHVVLGEFQNRAELIFIS